MSFGRAGILPRGERPTHLRKITQEERERVRAREEQADKRFHARMEHAGECRAEEGMAGTLNGGSVIEGRPWEPEWRREKLLRPEVAHPPIRAGTGATQRMRGSEDVRQRAFRSIMSRFLQLAAPTLCFIGCGV